MWRSIRARKCFLPLSPPYSRSHFQRDFTQVIQHQNGPIQLSPSSSLAYLSPSLQGGCNEEGQGQGCSEGGKERDCEPGDKCFLGELCSVVEETCGAGSCQFKERGGESCHEKVESYLSVPIPVETCLSTSSSNSNITKPTTCCFPPYELSDDTEECTLICPYYGAMSSDAYNAIAIAMSVLFGLGLVVAGVGIVPLISMKGGLTYPKYFLPLCVVIAEGFMFVYVFGYFLGKDHICDEEENMLIALPEYLDSAGCKVQGFFYTFFLFLLAYFHLILAVVIIACVFRDISFLSPFRPETASKNIEIFINVFGVLLSLTMGGISVGIAVDEEDGFDFVLANACVLSSKGPQLILWHLFFALSGFCLLALFYLVIRIVLMDWRIFLLQIRSVIILIYFITIVLFSATLTYLWKEITDLNEAQCVASSPPSSTAWKSCSPDTLVVYTAFAICYFAFYPIGVTCVSFLSTKIIRDWWFGLISKRTLERGSIRTMVRTSQ